MSRPRKDLKLTGKKYGRLTVLRNTGRVDKHRNQMWLCLCKCGREKEVAQCYLRRGVSKSCGCLQRETARDSRFRSRGKDHPAWKGGRVTTDRGYVKVLEGSGKDSVYVFEHRRVMEEHLGRPLRTKETVHHKNGVRNDNRIENLELRTSDHGPGQSVDDKVSYAVDILKEYRPDLLRL